jgi:hypothetical protein
MPGPTQVTMLEEQIDQWRSYLRRRQAIHSVDVAELEDHLREQVAALTEAGLAADEAFLVAVKRMGDLDALSREFAREHSERLWKQLVVVPSDADSPTSARRDAVVAFALAVAAALLLKAPELFTRGPALMDGDAEFYQRNVSLFVLPLLTGYFAWKRRLEARTIRWLAAALVAAIVFANVHPTTAPGHTLKLAAIHLPIALWLAVIVASWLVEAKQSVIENMAPVLTRLFTPLFTAVLVTFLATLLLTGRAVDIERNMLIPFNALLLLVLALLLYSISARDPGSPPGAFDVMQVVLLGCALVADALALWNIAARITEFGFSPNRVAVLGINVILLVNLAWSAVLYVRYLRARGSLAALEQWQTSYLPVYAAWAAIVVIVFPPLFGYR